MSAESADCEALHAERPAVLPQRVVAGAKRPATTSDYADPYIITIVRLSYFHLDCVILPENKHIITSNERNVQLLSLLGVKFGFKYLGGQVEPGFASSFSLRFQLRPDKTPRQGAKDC